MTDNIHPLLAYARQTEKDLGLPEGLAEQLIRSESDGEISARSKKGAIGLTQLLPSTAEELGIDPHDPEQNIKGGLTYFKKLYDQFDGDVLRAAAAYNAGPNNKAVLKGDSRLLPRETKNYVKDFYKFAPWLQDQETETPKPVSSNRTLEAEGVNDSLLNLINEAIPLFREQTGLDISLRSGYRPGDKRQHGHGNAIDLNIIKDGKVLPNYQNTKHFGEYEYLAQLLHQIAINKGLGNKLRWGGYFSGGKDKYGSMDLMHFDLAGDKIGMAGGNWENGLTPEQKRIWGINS